MRPTGPLHIGHLFGALYNWKKLQDAGYDCYYMIADWHALSTEYQSPSRIRENVMEIALDFIACGLEPRKSTIFIQSMVPEHAELHLVLSMIVPIPWLERNPVYKQQQEELKGTDLATYGFLGYPVLQAADILIYKANLVPIVVDQLPHLELTREIARRFNYMYGDFFPEPEPLLTEAPKVPGTDNRKMSKSYGNAIFLKDTAEEIRRKVSAMFTDPRRVYRSDPGHPDECPVFAYHKLVGSDTAKVKDECTNARVGCVQCKNDMAERLIEFLSPVREKRKQLSENHEQIWKTLRDGSGRASEKAHEVMRRVRQLTGINYEISL
jgi:tryptophanyl-tRNA synthetase